MAEPRLIDADLFFQFLSDRKVKETGAFSKGLNKGLNIARSALRNEDACPTVDAVPVVHGRWEERYVPNGEYVSWDGYYCSVCGKQAAKSNYCPNCGAKMDGGTQDV